MRSAARELLNYAAPAEYLGGGCRGWVMCGRRPRVKSVLAFS